MEPPQSLQYEDIFDNSQNFDEDSLSKKLFTRYVMDINGTNKLNIGLIGVWKGQKQQMGSQDSYAADWYDLMFEFPSNIRTYKT